jgi:magnesium chelatase family protein
MGDRLHPCTCSELARQKYRARLSGPILDRIDLHLEVQALTPEDLAQRSDQGLSTSEMRAQVLRAIAHRQQRQGDVSNAVLSGHRLLDMCAMDPPVQAFLLHACRRLGFSARAHDRVLRVARTIADLAEQSQVEVVHLAEAVAYRSADPRTVRMDRRPVEAREAA